MLRYCGGYGERLVVRAPSRDGGFEDFIHSTKSTGCGNGPIRPPRCRRNGSLMLRSAMQVGRMCEASTIKVAYLASLSAVKQAERLAPGLHCTALPPGLRHIWGRQVLLCNRTDEYQVAELTDATMRALSLADHWWTLSIPCIGLAY